MGVIRYDITEDAFDKGQLPQSELSILTGVDSSSYLIVDPAQQVLAIRALSHPAGENWWKVDDRLQHGYKKTRLAWLGSRFTIVPARLYSGDQRRSYLTGLTELKDTETVLADPLPELDAFLVYALDQEQLSEWRRSFVGCRFYHALTPVLKQLMLLNRQQGRAKVYAYFRNGMLITVGLDRNRLIFCNAFACPNTKDYLYYLLLTYEQCQWDPSQVPLRLFGEIMRDAEVHKLFYRYVRDVDFLSVAGMLRWGTQAALQPNHLFFDLAALQLYH
ncbi:MAG: hypothetical protein DA408_03205 [Bacteroidetes bacterium]|nr:MAG: hypothetical protein C7N36_01010 [Bacteroidota bacterium]PTM14294.1 MAG: hypothetical protein DA408_03205 [Bacteroidota bacterium]